MDAEGRARVCIYGGHCDRYDLRRFGVKTADVVAVRSRWFSFAVRRRSNNNIKISELPDRSITRKTREEKTAGRQFEVWHTHWQCSSGRRRLLLQFVS